MLNDIFNNMMYQEEMKINQLKLSHQSHPSQSDSTPRHLKTRNKQHYNDSRTFNNNNYRDSDHIMHYNRPGGACANNSQQQSFDKPPSSIFELKRFSNKDNLIDQLKKRHKFDNRKQTSTKRQSGPKHNLNNRGHSRSDMSSP